MKFEKRRASTKQEIPTASIFMVTTTLREVDVLVDFKLPEAQAIEKIENKRLVSYIWVGNTGRMQVNDSIVKLEEIQNIMYKKRQELPNVIVSMRVDKNSEMGLVTDIQQELRKAYCLRINYSTNIKI